MGARGNTDTHIDTSGCRSHARVGGHERRAQWLIREGTRAGWRGSHIGADTSRVTRSELSSDERPPGAVRPAAGEEQRHQAQLNGARAKQSAHLRHQALPERALDGRQIRCLTQARPAVHRGERREERAVMLPEVAVEVPVDAGVRVDAQELAGELHGDDFAVRQARRAPCSIVRRASSVRQ